MFATVSTAVAQIIAASVAGVVVTLTGYLSLYLRRIHKVVTKVESNTNGVMATQFVNVRRRHRRAETRVLRGGRFEAPPRARRDSREVVGRFQGR